MKKIAVICNYELLPERVGGMDRFFWLFNQECLKLNYQIDWFFPNVSHHGQYSELHIIAPEKNQTLESKFLQFSESENKKYDVVITHFLELCTSFSKKVKLQNPNTKFIAIDHNPRPIGGYPLKKRVEKRIKGLLYAPYTDLFVGVSDYTRKNILIDFGNHLSKKTIVVYNGIEFQQYQVRTNRAVMHPTFLVACHLRESKGIQDLIEAVHILPTEIKNHIVIDVYGGGEYKTHLDELISKYNLTNNFNFKGSVNNLYAIYFQYDYLLQPTHMECFSLSILESLSANVPVITTSVGGNEEAIEHHKNGYIYKPKDVLALKDIIQKVFEGKLTISENTRLLIETHFTIDKMVQEHLNLL
ncbi:MAG: group 1 glycosyl transferase [Flavobacteria bacterium RIFCSPLOWO2_12_FULL_31_7]|nr:MAG: group 1 glycosyl transferase [Flavobacteria bacterium RIFCSPLOWO2_12_FULL_31_7]